MRQRRLDFAQHLAHYRAHFRGPHLSMVVDSMLARNTAGRLWTVPGQSGPLLILWDKGNDVFYLEGAAKADASIARLQTAIVEQLVPQAQAAGVRRFKVRALSPSLEESLPRLFPGILLRPTVARFSVHDGTQQAGIPPFMLSDVTFLPIAPALLTRDDLAGMDIVREEIRGMWPSEDRFNTHGFGTLAVWGNEIICFCTAEYVGPTHCGIGIATAEEYQRRGVATAAATHFIEEARARGLTPCWECDVTNIASVRVAEKAGFVWQAEEAYCIGGLTDVVE